MNPNEQNQAQQSPPSIQESPVLPTSPIPPSIESKKSKTVLLFVATLVFILGGVGAYFYLKDSNDSKPKDNSITTDTANTVSSSTPEEAFVALKAKWLDLEKNQGTTDNDYVLEERTSDYDPTTVHVKSGSEYKELKAKNINAVGYRSDPKSFPAGGNVYKLLVAYDESLDRAITILKEYITSDLGMKLEDVHTEDNPASSTEYTLYVKDNFYCQIADTSSGFQDFACILK